MDYSTYSVTDFVLDEAFQQWVKNPNSPAPWESVLAANPHQKEVIEQARLVVLAVDFVKTPVQEINRQQLWQNIQHGIREPTASSTYTESVENRSHSFFRYWQQTAAVVAAILVMGALAFFLLTNRQSVVHTTAYGDSQEIQLPDGSTVTLNANSTLRYPKNWTADQVREVWLEGEAFFRIVKKAPANQASRLPSARFMVHTEHLHIEVLGTEFDVKNRRGNTQVVLNSGKVSLHRDQAAGTPELIMEPKDLVEYSPAAQTLTKRRVDPVDYAAWVSKRLVFNETPLAEIAQLLEDNYGLTVVFGNERLAQRKFTGSATTDNISLLLTSIQESFRLTVNRNGNEIRLDQ